MTKQPEFRHVIAVDEIPNTGREFALEANAEERVALADRFALLALDRLVGTLRVKPLAGGPIYQVVGEVQADLTQACVVTLDPVPSKQTVEISAEFGPLEALPDELELTLGDDEPHEPIIDGRIDLGELVAQNLALALDPYPRAAHAEGGGQEDNRVSEFFGRDTDPEPAEDRVHPFADLVALKGKLRGRK